MIVGESGEEDGEEAVAGGDAFGRSADVALGEDGRQEQADGILLPGHHRVDLVINPLKSILKLFRFHHAPLKGAPKSAKDQIRTRNCGEILKE